MRFLKIVHLILSAFSTNEVLAKVKLSKHLEQKKIINIYCKVRSSEIGRFDLQIPNI